MDGCPTTKAGDHMFGHPKNPHREKWNGWKWDDLYRHAIDVLKAGPATVDNCGLQNMIQAEYMSSWNREQAQELMNRAQAQAEQPNPMSTLKDDMDMNLDNVPY